MPSKTDILTSASSFASSYFQDIKRKTSSISGEEYCYLEGGKGETIIFLHGLGISKTYWRSSLSQLQKSYHVIALDIPGLNIQAELSSKRATFARLSDWLNNFFEYKHIVTAHLVAQSVSSGICAYFASSYPNQVSSIAFVSIPQWFSTPEYPRPLIFNLIYDIEKADSKAMDLYVSSNFHTKPRVSKHMRAAHIWLFKKYFHRIKATIQDLELSFQQLPARLRKLECPSLIIYGEHDEFIGKNMKPTLKEWLPNSEIATIPNCGHNPSMEKPTVFHQRYTDFIKNI